MNGTYIDVDCVGCGVPRRRFIPDGLRGPWRERLVAMPLMCEGCAERDEKSQAEEAAQRARLAEHRNTQHRIRCSGVPEQLREAALSQLDSAQPVAEAAAWAECRLRGLLLSGPVGAGKTHTAAAAVMAALRIRQVTWLSAPALFAQLSADRGTRMHSMAIEALAGTTALALDDLDKARPTDYGAEQIFAAIDSRVAAGKPLLVTTNLDPHEIATRYPQPYGEAIVSRLLGYCTWVRIEGDDRRMRGAA